MLACDTGSVTQIHQHQTKIPSLCGRVTVYDSGYFCISDDCRTVRTGFPGLMTDS